ncbi:MAG TPA: hypothetical protein VEJ38_02120 [Candidatus Acidoferrales bacterium]|nr:hypothetical protein [Candidatus Acidoferrales bacterium]
MADWRQIQARIRKAKNSPEAVSKLSELFKRTRDGMVAWELGAIEEKADHKEEAGNWYVIAAQRFRRADWKKKAEEALTRLGIAIPAHAETAPPERSETAGATEHAAEPESEKIESAAAPEETPEEGESQIATGAVPAPATGTAGEQNHRKRRRGRRGGRGRRRKEMGGAPGLPGQAFSERPVPAAVQPEAAPSPVVERRALDRVETEPPTPEQLRPIPAEAPRLPSERVAHGRSDPAVASRMAHLESLLRRLLGSPLHKLDEADQAPAGPGVFLLTESDQTASYYVEACQTLRVGLGNLARGGKGGRGGRGPSEANLKAKLAEHLGINEAKVSQYLKDHCCVRWIQLDDDAPLLAHFAIAVLRTPLNLD